LTFIPVALAPFTASDSEENYPSHYVVTGLLVVVACLSSFQTVMRFDAAAAKHDSSSWRYQDLVSDAEEVLSKKAPHRPDPDLFVSKIKTRSDFIARFAPDVDVPEETDSDDDASSRDGYGEATHPLVSSRPQS
jgi:hypothetical protein